MQSHFITFTYYRGLRGFPASLLLACWGGASGRVCGSRHCRILPGAGAGEVPLSGIRLCRNAGARSSSCFRTRQGKGCQCDAVPQDRLRVADGPLAGIPRQTLPAVAEAIPRPQRSRPCGVCREAAVHSPEPRKARAVHAPGGLEVEQLPPLRHRRRLRRGDRVAVDGGQEKSECRQSSFSLALRFRA